MGNYLSSPNQKKKTENGNWGELRYGLCEMQGWRVAMEDAHLVHFFEKLTPAGTSAVLFGVYDGHGGAHISQFVSRHIVEELLKVPEFRKGHFDSAFKTVYFRLDSLLMNEEYQNELQWLYRNSISETGEDCPYPLPSRLTPALPNIENMDSVVGKSSAKKFTKSQTKIGGKRSKKGRRKKIATAKSLSEKFSKTTSSQSWSSLASQNQSKDNFPDNTSYGTESNYPSISYDSISHHTLSHFKMGGVNEERKSDEMNIPKSSVECKGWNKTFRESQADRPATKEVSESEEETRTNPIANCSASNDSHKLKKSTTLFKHSRTGHGSFKKKSAVVEEKLKKDKGTNSDDFTNSCKEKDTVEARKAMKASKEYYPKTNPQDSQEHIKKPSVFSFQNIKSVLSNVLKSSLNGFKISPFKAPGVNYDYAMLAGCTALTVLITEKQIIVANAGDSRCVLCRKGTGIELSKDHKPSLPEERMRIYSAGGWLEMGRVNGNLNLSRAIGDLVYKLNTSLVPERQIVTAAPDIVFMNLTALDEFLLIACDGIWESFPTQDIVNFVRERIDTVDQLSDILEALFGKLISPNPVLLEFGCDNMTAILIDLKPLERLKRKSARDAQAHQKLQGAKAGSEKSSHKEGEEKTLNIGSGFTAACESDAKNGRALTAIQQCSAASCEHRSSDSQVFTPPSESQDMVKRMGEGKELCILTRDMVNEVEHSSHERISTTFGSDSMPIKFEKFNETSVISSTKNWSPI